jgi:hypothetical protein
MLKPDLLVSAIIESRCVRTRLPLAPDEFLVSRSAFPALYAGKHDRAEDKYLREISRTIASVLSGSAASAAMRGTIRDFMTFVIDSGEMYREEFIHRYVFEFWDTLWDEPEDAIVLTERYFKGNTSNVVNTTQFSLGFVPYIRTSEAEIDIVGLGGASNRTVYLIEIKLDDADDRALGQILRYYRLARDACDQRYHGCDIRQVRPVLIVKQMSLAAWDAVPQYFRELLSVYLYRVRSGRVVLLDAKRILQSQLRDRLYA